jgi:4'-phosphopantetheinyl transferase
MLAVPPIHGPFSPGVVHLWSLTLPEQTISDQSPESITGFTILSSEEQERAQRYIRPISRYQFITTRACLRHLLGQYLQQNPQTLCFEYSSSGKPSLQGEKSDFGLQFNLSHSREQVLYAISLDLTIGVDLEWRNPNLQYLELANRICTANEWEVFKTLSATQQQDRFFKIWTRKEALIKYFGDRLFDELLSYEVTMPSTFCDWVETQGQQVWLQDLDLWDDFAAAIALTRPPQQIQTYCWRLDR